MRALKPLKEIKTSSLADHIESSHFNGSFYEAERFRGLNVTKEGLDMIKNDLSFFENLLIGTFRRVQKYSEHLNWDGEGEEPERFSSHSLSPHVKGSFNFLGSLSEGAVFEFNKENKSLALKVYHSQEESSSLENFEASLLVQKDDFFKVPKQYFASSAMCVRECFPRGNDYWGFIKKNPFEEKILVNYLKSFTNKGKDYFVDLGDIFAYYSEKREPSLREESSLFVLDFNPEFKDPKKRYVLGAVDINSQ